MIKQFFDMLNRPQEIHTYKNGVYTTGARTIEKADEPLVVVHPFFIEKHSGRQGIMPSAEVYVPKLETLVATHKGPVITFEEKFELERTAIRYKQAKRTDDSYLIKTQMCDCCPSELSLEEVVDFIKSFNPKTLKLAGGFLYNGGATGCLGSIGEFLAGQGFWTRILEDCTFSYIPEEKVWNI